MIFSPQDRILPTQVCITLLTQSGHTSALKDKIQKYCTAKESSRCWKHPTLLCAFLLAKSVHSVTHIAASLSLPLFVSPIWAPCWLLPALHLLCQKVKTTSVHTPPFKFVCGGAKICELKWKKNYQALSIRHAFDVHQILLQWESLQKRIDGPSSCWKKAMTNDQEDLTRLKILTVYA